MIPLNTAHLRIARPTERLPEIVRFYRDGLGFNVIASFEDHDGFDGMMLGLPGLPYHLEFTHRRGHQVGSAPTQDNLLVFYLPNASDWQQAIDRMTVHGFAPVKSCNPYWDVNGNTFEDADGYRVVIQQASWP